MSIPHDVKLRPKVALLIHGIMNDNGKKSVDKLRPFLQEDNFIVKELDYDFTNPLEAQISNKRMAAALDSIFTLASQDHDIYAFAHSNGAIITHLASRMSCNFKKIFYINAACDPWLTPGPLVEECIVCYSPYDYTVNLAPLFLGTLGGTMGREGYIPEDGLDYDPRMINVDTSQELNLDPDKKHHSIVFSDVEIEDFYNKIIKPRI